ncbi:hypothetical protein [Oceanomicrobium pacificus]|uniref:DUF4956 domain-containing protein n=1 Tax=Oceanomicrobium pacificus TaxID=2692916 RepID=A0A6B0U6G8_9RHOB|nr:hypothetical protein [Oceanomicrobium pacificus]MXU66461.1 hypothetical protein [Oceanomicrobium pacificus]
MVHAGQAGRIGWALGVMVVATAGAVFAQSPLVPGVEPSGRPLTDTGFGGGYAALMSPSTMLGFLRDVVIGFGLTALIAFHPSLRHLRNTVEEAEIPRTQFLYALVGMVIGFLVVTHGSIIGFIVFGIGGLMRFRTDLGSSARTGECIVVTVVGLCIGLELPVVAVMTTLSAWVVIWFINRTRVHVIELIAPDFAGLDAAAEAARSVVDTAGWRHVGEKHGGYKPHMRILFSAPSQVTRGDILDALRAGLGPSVPDERVWHLAD